MTTIHCRNGVAIRIHADRTEIALPDGQVIEGRPHPTEDYAEIADRLGYGADTLAMCLEHDPLHALLASWLGLPTSMAAGLNVDPGLAAIEEDAVLAVQRLMRAAGLTLPV